MRTGCAVETELARGLAARPPDAGLCVAFSGGRDSTVLLAVCVRLAAGRPLRAVHVHHGLHASAGDWARHCVEVGRRLRVPVEVQRVTVKAAGRGLEAAARTARYAALATGLAPGEHLLTAHHADDQLETLLLHLVRGSGVEGLAGIPALAPLAAGWLWRPLLGVPAVAMAAAATRLAVPVLADPANDDLRFDRNYLRKVVVPALRDRFPAVALAGARSAALLADAAETLATQAAMDALPIVSGQRLDRGKFSALSLPRQRNLLRFLARRAGLPTPPESVLRQGLPAVLGARSDRSPAVRWPGAWLRRYRDGLYLLPDPGPDPGSTPATAWEGAVPLELGPWRGRLALAPGIGAGLKPAVASEGLELRFRSGAARLRPQGDRHHRDLKYLCQSAGIVPWMRPHLPLLYGAASGPFAGQLLAVGNLWLAAEAAAGAGEPALAVRWDGHPPLT